MYVTNHHSKQFRNSKRDYGICSALKALPSLIAGLKRWWLLGQSSANWIRHVNCCVYIVNLWWSHHLSPMQQIVTCRRDWLLSTPQLMAATTCWTERKWFWSGPAPCQASRRHDHGRPKSLKTVVDWTTAVCANIVSAFTLACDILWKRQLFRVCYWSRIDRAVITATYSLLAQRTPKILSAYSFSKQRFIPPANGNFITNWTTIFLPLYWVSKCLRYLPYGYLIPAHMVFSKMVPPAETNKNWYFVLMKLSQWQKRFAVLNWLKDLAELETPPTWNCTLPHLCRGQSCVAFKDLKQAFDRIIYMRAPDWIRYKPDTVFSPRAS